MIIANCCWLVAMVLLCIALPHAHAGDAFVDTFEDGNPADGNPVTWLLAASPFNRGTFAIKDGSLVLSPANSGPTSGENYWEIDVYSSDQTYHNFSLRTQLRGLADSNSVVGIGGLDTESATGPTGSGVWGYLLLDGTSQQLTLGGNVGTESPFSQLIPTKLSHISDEMNLQFTVYEDLASVYAWPTGTPKPSAPQLVRQLPEALRSAEGSLTLWAGSRTESVPAAFRYVDVTPNPWEHGQLALLPAVQYHVNDVANDGVVDNLGDVTTVSGGSDLVGENDTSSSNYVSRLVSKFDLPEDALSSGQLKSATLRFQLVSANNAQGAVSLYHSTQDNDLDVAASDYEDASYVDTGKNVIDANVSTRTYYEVEVTDQILQDLAADGDHPFAAFRLQLDGARFEEDQVSNLIRFGGPSSSTTPPMLVLNFVPEPTTSFLAWAALPFVMTQLRRFGRACTIK